MKKLIICAVAIVFCASTLPLFAADDSSGKELDVFQKAYDNLSDPGCTKGMVNLFQKVYDDMNKPGVVAEKDKVKPIGPITCFQNISDGIKEGSAKAKNLSLRDKQ